MADLGGTYDATHGATMSDRTALPAGTYTAQIVKSERRDTKQQTGSYINLEFEVLDSEHPGRRFWTMLNLWNQNAQAVEIAQRELNSICHACGKLRVTDTEELHAIPMAVTLGVKSDNYGEKNIVKKYEQIGGASARPGAPAGAPAPTPTALPAQPGQRSAPWGRTA
ncbi:MAG: DUF669 domain-containing protein [Pseudomonadota bacterium]